MKVRIYRQLHTFDEATGDTHAARRTQRTHTGLSPVQAARLLRSEGLTFNGCAEAFDNEHLWPEAGSYEHVWAEFSY